MSKTCVIFHEVDLDGWMSGAIVKKWWNEMPEMKSAYDTIDFIGYNYGQQVPDLKDYDRVIMCDISFPKEEMEKLFDRLEGNFVWIDHHISAINMMFSEGERSIHPLGLQDVKFSACELTWKYFFPEKPMPELVRLLGRYDCFGHKGTDEELKVLIPIFARSLYSDVKKYNIGLCKWTWIMMTEKGKANVYL